MLVSESRAAELKTWVTKKLEDISDADADVLADYVIALIRSDTHESALRRNVIENLEDFLRDNTAAFVDELLKKVAPQGKPKSFDPAAPQFIPSVVSDTGHSARYGLAAADNPRKRPFPGAQGVSSPTRQHGRNDRQAKHMRSGGPVRGSGARVTKASHTKGRQGIPFDPQQAAAALWTLESMGFPIPQLSLGGDAFPQNATGPMWHAKGKGKGTVRCKDYDTIGICQRGANCPYLHDANQIIVPPGSDHSPPATTASNGYSAGEAAQVRNGGATRGRGKPQRGRADFSQIGPSRDTSMSSIVIEHIPEEYLSEDSVREFFTIFGQIQDVRVQPESSLAIVQYASHDAATAAYESPKVIFDNRFVKVYWYKPNRHHNKHGPSQEDSFDREAFEKELEAAQKRFEERKALKDENDAKVAEVQQQRAELQRKKEEERQKLLEKIREKRPSEPTATDEKSSTEVLRAKLKWLEEEAESLGLDPAPWDSEHPGHGRGRGAYRGRASFGGRLYRGAHRGRRGAHRGGLPRGGAYNLDNRPRTVKVEGMEFDAAKDEALRQYLINIGEFTAIEPDSSGASQTITFKDRPTAERFFYGPRDVPGVGKLEMSWVAGAPPIPQKSSFDLDEDMDPSSGEEPDGNATFRYHTGEDETREMDYDVAEDEER